MKRIIFTFFFCCFLSGCGLTKQQAPFVREGYRVGGCFLSEVKSRYGYQAHSIGGAFPDKINGFIYSFYTYKELSEDLAEERIKSMHQLLTDIVNHDSVVRPYLSEWPFENRETCISLTFLDPIHGSFRSEPKIAMIAIQGGKLLKFYYNPETGRLMNEKKYERYLEENDCVEKTSSKSCQK